MMDLKQKKLDDLGAEDLLLKIANEDVSDGDFSDDESKELDVENNVSAMVLAFRCMYVELIEVLFILAR